MAVLCVMTHGVNGGVYGSNGETVDIGRFFERLDKWGKEKPKLVIIQACREPRKYYKYMIF